MITAILTTIFGFILFIFLLHFVGLYFSKYILNNKDKFRDSIQITKKLSIHTTRDPSLMVSFSHYDKMYLEEEYEGEKYTHKMCITIGGFYIYYEYGHDYWVDTENSYEFCKTTYYGLYSIDSERWWRSIWWANHLYDNPFTSSYFLGLWYFNFDTLTLINDKDFDKYAEPEKLPYFKIIRNTTYTNKNGTIQNVPYIKFSIEERRWTSIILQKLGLNWLYNKKRVDLEFECKNDGDSEFNGLGIRADSWKGGVYGSGISLNQDPELYTLYNQITEKNQVNLYSKFINLLDKRIEQFLHVDKKY